MRTVRLTASGVPSSTSSDEAVDGDPGGVKPVRGKAGDDRASSLLMASVSLKWKVGAEVESSSRPEIMKGFDCHGSSSPLLLLILLFLLSLSDSEAI
jgi:hypothetical protein